MYKSLEDVKAECNGIFTSTTGRDGHIKLTDFGLCRYFDISPSLHNFSLGREVAHVTHSFVGTEEYMSPEVLLNQVSIQAE